MCQPFVNALHVPIYWKEKKKKKGEEQKERGRNP
jgi:hypothetical protein